MEGITQALLTSAGYGHTAAVHYEHAGALPSPFQGKPLWARGDVVMAAVRAPVGDRELRALPTGFDTSSGRVHITVITAVGPRGGVVVDPVPPPAQQRPQPTAPGMVLARSLMRGQGWREGQPLGARGHQGAVRVAPLDATADLGGRPPAVRTSISFVRASTPSGHPTPPHPSPAPETALQLRRDGALRGLGLRAVRAGQCAECLLHHHAHGSPPGPAQRDNGRRLRLRRVGAGPGGSVAHERLEERPCSGLSPCGAPLTPLRSGRRLAGAKPYGHRLHTHGHLRCFQLVSGSLLVGVWLAAACHISGAD